ncbi:MAG: polymerase sigma factor SigL, partial [Verrucomicrobiota bacterium]|jgi:RNA polymerase sigma-70 factor (ECF subfamily)
MAHSAEDIPFIEALARHQPALEAFCYANLGRRGEVREVLQSVVVRLWEKSAEWDPKTNFLPWAFAVARFTVLAHFRDQARDRLVFDEEVVLAMAEETEQAAEQFEVRREALGACLEKLGQDQRSLLHEFYIAGQSLRALARAMSRSESALKMTVLRLRSRLRTCVDRQLAQTT